MNKKTKSAKPRAARKAPLSPRGAAVQSSVNKPSANTPERESQDFPTYDVPKLSDVQAMYAREIVRERDLLLTIYKKFDKYTREELGKRLRKALSPCRPFSPLGIKTLLDDIVPDWTTLIDYRPLNLLSIGANSYEGAWKQLADRLRGSYKQDKAAGKLASKITIWSETVGAMISLALYVGRTDVDRPSIDRAVTLYDSVVDALDDFVVAQHEQTNLGNESRRKPASTIPWKEAEAILAVLHVPTTERTMRTWLEKGKTTKTGTAFTMADLSSTQAFKAWAETYAAAEKSRSRKKEFISLHAGSIEQYKHRNERGFSTGPHI